MLVHLIGDGDIQHTGILFIEAVTGIAGGIVTPYHIVTWKILYWVKWWT